MTKENRTKDEDMAAYIDLMGGDMYILHCSCGNEYVYGDHGEFNPGILGCIPRTYGDPEPSIHWLGGMETKLGIGTVTYHCDCGEILVGQVWTKKIMGPNIIVNEALKKTEMMVPEN